MKAKRIAVLGMSYEALLRSPWARDSMEVHRGQDMLDNNLWLVRGIHARLAEEEAVEIVPLLWATALPGGPLTRACYDAVRDEAAELLRGAGPLDGVVLANHGAMEVEGLDEHADAHFTVAIREAVGAGVPIAVALDLHGNISDRMVDLLDVVSVLRTAPHRDDFETGHRAADQLLRVIERGLKPRTAAVHIPILITGEQAMTTFAPARELYAALPEIDTQPGIMEANILVGFAFNDRPWTGMTALVTHESDSSAAQAQAEKLADRIWERRQDFVLRNETAELREGLLKANADPKHAVYLSDSGDNTTAGAPGDLTWVLQEILSLPEITDAVVPGICAPEAVRLCHEAGIGETVELKLGDEHFSGPKRFRKVKAVVAGIGDSLKPSGFQPYFRTAGAWARVDIGGVIATFHAEPIGITTPAHLEMTGIDPSSHKMYVVKLGYLHPQLEDIAARHILLMTDGTANLRLGDLTWEQVRRPAYPIDPDMQWSPPGATSPTLAYGPRARPSDQELT